MEIPREREVLKAKILEAKYEGVGVQDKKRSVEGGGRIWIFFGTAHSAVTRLTGEGTFFKYITGIAELSSSVDYISGIKMRASVAYLDKSRTLTPDNGPVVKDRLPVVRVFRAFTD